MNPQVVEADGDGADVHDGVDGTHLVEQHRVGRRAVRLGLRAGELAEDGERDVLRALRKAGCLDDGMDVRERAVRMVVTMLVLVLVAVLMLVLVAVVVPLVGFFPVLAKEPCMSWSWFSCSPSSCTSKSQASRPLFATRLTRTLKPWTGRVSSAARSCSSLAPRSSSAATVMSPLMPEEPSTMRARRLPSSQPFFL